MATTLKMRALDPAWKFALGAFIAMRVALTAWSLIVVLLLPVVPQNLDLFGAPVLAVFDAQTNERYAYSRVVDGRVLTFRAGARGFVEDIATGSVWSLRQARALDGEFAGRALAASPYPVEQIYPYYGVAPATNLLLAPWQRFDTNWYLAIATRGYGSVEGDAHFPPLYPALMRGLGAMLGGNFFLAALLISNLTLIAALAILHQLARELFGATIAARTIAYLVIFPTAFFFFCAYTESPFLLVALLALRALRRRAWVWAGFWSFCAILLRLQGVALFVPLAYALGQARPFDHKRARASALALPLLASGLYLAMRWLTGDPSVVPLAETTLHARLAPPWENYFYALATILSGRFHLADALNLISTTFCAIVLVIGWRALPREFSLFAAASLIVLTMRVVETQPLNSMSRYALTLFPIFIVLAHWGKKPWAQRAIVYGSFMLALFLSAQFVLWGWVG
ncbi:MAG: hypothetical protein HZC40_14960 [Chloroflexi bacterium]|nr:hypothetical protein [Chloroflexota bacterium]